MKKTLFFASLLLSISMAAQSQTEEMEYRPMAEEGKKWQIQFGFIMENENDHYIKGDTIIGGETWKKVYNNQFWPGVKDSYFAAIRDDGKKVYAIVKGSTRPRLLYDFGLKEGSLVKCGMESTAFGCLLDSEEKPDTLLGFPFEAYLRVERIDTVKAHYNKNLLFRRFTLSFLDRFRQFLRDDDEGVVSENVVWVEGVGSSNGLFTPWMTILPKYRLSVTCYIHGAYLFGRDIRDRDDEEIENISNIRYDTGQNNTIYDLQGQCVTGTPHPGIYIQQGRKRVVR